MNRVQLIGRATHNPRSTTASNGTAVTTFRVAVDRPGDETDFVTVKAWDRVAQTIDRYLTRGRRVAITGRLQHDEWTGQDGQRAQRLIVVANYVHFLDPPNRQPHGSPGRGGATDADSTSEPRPART